MAVTEAEVQSEISNLVKLFHECRDFAETNTPNFKTLFDTYVQALEGEYTPEALAGAQQVRDRFAAMLTRDAWIGPLTAHLRDYAQVIGVPETTAEGIMGRLYDHFVTNAYKVTSRAITYNAAVAGGSNVGNGSLLRLTVDENAYNLEACTPEVKTCKCVLDANSGTRQHEELFEMRGEEAARDGLSLAGSGALGALVCVSPSNALNYLQNASFSDYSGTEAVPTEIPGWTPTTALANFQLASAGSNYYRDADGDTAQRSLRIDATDVMTQALSVRKAPIDPNLPYMLEVAWNRQVGAVTGTLVIHLGSKSVSVAVAAQTGWQKLRLALDQNLWFKNWNQNGASVKIDWTRTSGAGTYLLVDDVTLSPLQPFDGTYWWLIGGATRFLRDDVYTITDTGGAPTTGLLQYFFARHLGRYLPHGAATWADPAS